MEEADSYKVKLAGLSLEHGLTNGAGTCKLIDGKEGVRALARSAVAAIMVGSITYAARTGYGGTDYFSNGDYSLNARGLPNPGLEYYREHLPEMVAIAHNENNKNPGLEPKPLFVSIAGFDIFEYANLAHFAFNAGADLVELNLSCPNVKWGNDWFEVPVCYNLELLRQILNCVQTAVGKDARVAVKLSYFPDRVVLKKTVETITSFEVVKAITAINTLHLAYGYDELGNPRLSSTGFGGLGGRAIKPLGIGQVKLLREMCPPEFDIIGCGGIATGQDIADYLRAGAKAVYVATAFCDEGAGVFSRLLKEFVDVMDAANS